MWSRVTSITAAMVFSSFLLYSASTMAECVDEIPQTTPNSQLIDNNDGTITDSATGLMWQQCSQGQSGGLCSGTATSHTWQQALAIAESLNNSGGFAGYADWRLPNRKELRSIVEQACSVPSINSTRFPNTPSLDFWSASANASLSSYAWYVGFYGGDAYAGKRSDGRRVRLVRGGQ